MRVPRRPEATCYRPDSCRRVVGSRVGSRSSAAAPTACDQHSSIWQQGGRMQLRRRSASRTCPNPCSGVIHFRSGVGKRCWAHHQDLAVLKHGCRMTRTVSREAACSRPGSCGRVIELRTGRVSSSIESPACYQYLPGWKQRCTVVQPPSIRKASRSGPLSCRWVIQFCAFEASNPKGEPTRNQDLSARQQSG
jgi:hypothetical protein